MKISAAFVSLALSLGLVNAQISLSPAPGTVISSCNRPGVIALTFDDGPGPDMSRLVDTLNAAGAKATFFVTGTLYGCIYNRADMLKKAYNAGHQIASHTWSHPNMGSYSTSQIQTEMKRLEQALVNILGVRPTYMRAPYLAAGGNVPTYMRGDHYRIIQTDVDTQDWNNISAQQSFQRLQQAGASGNGHIPLMHETVSSTPSQLAPLVINWAKQNNLKMVTVAECLGDSTPYINGAGGGQQNCNAAYTPGTTQGGAIPTPTGGNGGGNTQPAPTPTPTPGNGGGTNCSARWGQCGGQSWTGPTCCSEGTCRQSNQWYSQCQ